METFPSIEAFYAADEARRRSPELDYGVHWRERDLAWPTYRISYVDLTGELYAIANAGADRGAVELLARYPLRPCPTCDGTGGDPDACHACAGTGYSRQLVEAALAGWADVCGEQGSLEWARDRARIADPAYSPTVDEALEHPDAMVAGMQELAPCDHDGWVSGCPYCEQQERLARSQIGQLELGVDEDPTGAER